KDSSSGKPMYRAFLQLRPIQACYWREHSPERRRYTALGRCEILVRIHPAVVEATLQLVAADCVRAIVSDIICCSGLLPGSPERNLRPNVLKSPKPDLP